MDDDVLGRTNPSPRRYRPLQRILAADGPHSVSSVAQTTGSLRTLARASIIRSLRILRTQPFRHSILCSFVHVTGVHGLLQILGLGARWTPRRTPALRFRALAPALD